MELYNRAFTLRLQSDEGRVRIGSDTVDGAVNNLLRIMFDIERDLSKEPNSAKISIYNLSRDTRALISSDAVQVILEAGYAGYSNTIFTGSLDYGATVRNGADLITTFESTDGGSKLRSSRINISFAPGITVQEAIKKAAESIGLGLGNVIEKASQGNIRGALQAFGNGLVLSGNAKAQLDKVCKLAGYDWSVQDGQIQLLETAGFFVSSSEVITLNKGTGLVGTPEPGEKGKVSARSLLIPDLVPGRLVRIESETVNGLHRIQRTAFTGDTWGQPWYADMDLKPRG